MDHIIQLVIEWAVFGLVVAVVAALVGFAYRAVMKREWSNVVILEGAFAVGVVMGFVWLVFLVPLSILSWRWMNNIRTEHVSPNIGSPIASFGPSPRAGSWG